MKFEVGDRVVVLAEGLMHDIAGRTGIIIDLPTPNEVGFIRVDLDELDKEPYLGKNYPFRAEELEWEPRWEEQQAYLILGEDYFA